MKIFKYFSALSMFASLLAIQSCSIDEQLYDTPTPDAIKTEADVIPVITGMYSRFNDASAFKFQGMNMMILTADDIYSDAGSEFGPWANRTFSGVNTGSFWNNFYATIGHANHLIKLMEDKDLDEAFEKRTIGEAQFLRAFSYYYLVRFYGGVPLRLDDVNIDSDFYLPRSSVDQVYAQIFEDLKNASKNLPLASAIPAAELGRASKGAAQAIMAQAYLTYGNQLSLKGQSPTEQYNNSVVYADSVIKSGQYNLIPNYADIFDISKEAAAYKEVIFGIRFQTDNQNRAQPAAGSEFALRFNAPNTAGTTGRANTTGAGSYRVMPWFADFYRTGDYVQKADPTIPTDVDTIDYRNETALFARGTHPNGRPVIMYPGITASGQERIATPLVGKYKDPNGKDERNHGNDFFVIRFAEVYLIKAEALNELNGPTKDAIDAFNMVRKRAQFDGTTTRPVPYLLPNDGTANLTKEAFRMKIFHERGLELVGEGQRWFDLVRMQHPTNPSKTMYEYQFAEELKKPQYSKKLPAWNATLGDWDNRWAVYQPSLNVTFPKFLLFPIPSSETLNNPNIGQQNPGW
ncbi:MAG: RagB/SusD family nutrient uptake outer membrane protein [Rufibacter sp.]